MAKRGVNKVVLVGNLGADPEVRATHTNDIVINFSVATSEAWKDKNTGQPNERTEWHRCVAFGPLAGICERFLQKGTKVYCEGSLRTRKWQDQNGNDRYATQIHLDEMQVLAGGRQDDGAPAQRQEPNHFQRVNRPGPPPDARYNNNGTQRSPYQSAPPPQNTGTGGYDTFDDDIPF